MQKHAVSVEGLPGIQEGIKEDINSYLTPNQMEQKAVASAIFSGRKLGYAESLNEVFVDSRLSE